MNANVVWHVARPTEHWAPRFYEQLRILLLVQLDYGQHDLLVDTNAVTAWEETVMRDWVKMANSEYGIPSRSFASNQFGPLEVRMFAGVTSNSQVKFTMTARLL